MPSDEKQMTEIPEITYDLHVAKSIREKFGFETSLFSVTGNLLIADFNSARLLSDKINKNIAPGQYVTPGLLNAAGLFHEIMHLIIRSYERDENPGVFERGVRYVSSVLKENSDQIFRKFIEEFPPLSVYNGSMKADEYLEGSTGGRANRHIILEELILLNLENLNPGFAALKELFDDKPLKEIPAYAEFLSTTEQFFDNEPPLGAEKISLLKALKKPIEQFPSDVLAQLTYISEKWSIYLDEDIKLRVLGGTDLIKEDAKLFMARGGTGTPPIPEYQIALQEYMAKIKLMLEQRGGQMSPEEWAKLQKEFSLDDISMSYLQETEQFTEDVDWMPNVVMIAKNSFVWLDQLSKKYGRDITRLDQIPDEEIDILVSRNINTLWFIGLWERSAASKKIKQFCGNPDATSSAYSLYDYEIARALGGDAAFENFKYRCAQKGVRLASDMVPNHTGVFSKWVLSHPEYFIQRVSPPYPSYSFTGPDLSDDSAVQIRIEDKYYTRQDAAVVFQIIDNRTGMTRYIYHGNDGTNMPWNDTAQLNLLLPEVREALIQTIMHVAKKTPVIRFDAAMTLAKKHFSRLWFPQPGSGGAIPSRAEYAMTQDMFNSHMPVEFWREVVDRMNAEMPNTLLLAEAFWLMEGYFVRTLGMHRVYNSAFMHMFMKEENDKYRKLIKNTLEFNPEILKRYVNFMSNPDEETAANQYGKGDKYFGVAVMMSTLPGLPMFAHGQIEGFTEKYGMEFARAYLNETPDSYLIKRHETEIFPLLKIRHLFAEVKYFELYDFVDEYGDTDENVFAFTNGNEKDKVLVVYNNSYQAVSGTINYSSGKTTGDKQEDEFAEIKTIELSGALSIVPAQDSYIIYKEHPTSLEYIVAANDITERGMNFRLNGYQFKVLMNFRQVSDTVGKYKKLAKLLNGTGVSSIETALREMNLMPFHNAVTHFFTKENLQLLNGKVDSPSHVSLSDNPDIQKVFSPVVRELGSYVSAEISTSEILTKLESDLEIIREIRDEVIPRPKLGTQKNTLGEFTIDFDSKSGYRDLIVIYTVIRRLLLTVQSVTPEGKRKDLYEALMLSKPLWQCFIRLSDDYAVIREEFNLLNIFSTADGIFPRQVEESGKLKNPVSSQSAMVALIELMISKEIQQFLGFNSYMGRVYFNKEKYETLLKWSYTIELLRRTAWLNGFKDADKTPLQKNKNFIAACSLMSEHGMILKQKAESAGYDFDILRESLLAPAVPAEDAAKPEKPKPTRKKAASKKKTAADDTVKKKVSKKASKMASDKKTQSGGIQVGMAKAESETDGIAKAKSLRPVNQDKNKPVTLTKVKNKQSPVKPAKIKTKRKTKKKED